MWSPYRGAGAPPLRNQTPNPQDFCSTPVNRFDSRLRYSPYQSTPDGSYNRQAFIPRSPLGLSMQRAYPSPTAYFSPDYFPSGRFISPNHQNAPSDLLYGANSASSGSYFTCQETPSCPSFHTGDSAGTSGSVYYHDDSFHHHRQSGMSRGKSRRGGGYSSSINCGTNWISRSLSDPWSGVKPRRTPTTTGGCLVATALVQRHTVLFANRFVPPLESAADSGQATEVDDVPPRKRFSSSFNSPQPPSPSSLVMPTFD